MIFDKMLALAENVAVGSKMELTALTYYPNSQEWVAYYSDEKGSSFVKMQDWTLSAMLNRLEGNYELTEDDTDE